MIEYSDYFVLGIGVLIAGISWMLRKEHARIESLEGSHAELGERVARAINEIAKNDVADHEWRKRVEENHRGLLKADEDRRGDARKIYDKIENTQKEIQRLAEKIAGKR